MMFAKKHLHSSKQSLMWFLINRDDHCKKLCIFDVPKCAMETRPCLWFYFLWRTKWISSNGYYGWGTGYYSTFIVKLGTQEADLSIKEVDEIIGSICEVASRFTRIADDLLPRQIQAETLQMIQNRIEHNVHLLNWI